MFHRYDARPGEESPWCCLSPRVVIDFTQKTQLNGVGGGVASGAQLWALCALHCHVLPRAPSLPPPPRHLCCLRVPVGDIGPVDNLPGALKFCPLNRYGGCRASCSLSRLSGFQAGGEALPCLICMAKVPSSQAQLPGTGSRPSVCVPARARAGGGGGVGVYVTT
jgi:hypothetical protein